MGMHIDQLGQLATEVFGLIPENAESDDPFAPRYFCTAYGNARATLAKSQKLALCPGSVLIGRMSFSETFNQMISGIKVRMAFLTTSINGTFFMPKEGVYKEAPFFITSSLFSVLFYQCDEQKIQEFFQRLAMEHRISSLILDSFTHIHCARRLNLKAKGRAKIVSNKPKKKKKTEGT